MWLKSLFQLPCASRKLPQTVWSVWGTLRQYMQHHYLLQEEPRFDVIAASPGDLPAPACYLQFLQAFVVARSWSNMLSEPWRDKALPDMCLKSQGSLRLSDMCQKSPAPRRLPTPPQTATGTALPVLPPIADISPRWQISTTGSHLLLRCQMYSTAGGILSFQRGSSHFIETTLNVVPWLCICNN